ncbi:MAG TPA: hypothetical protein DD827_01305 [Gammaproteobacteria bacterium]|nr:hypothetical protein [Gammaproteobacteria bacterium]
MRVYITIDTECREERLDKHGDLIPAAGYDTRVWGRFENSPNELGIPLIMNTLEANGFKGCFFVDPFGSHSFGRYGLQEVCGNILARGHDVQLHAHPRQRVADWKSRGLEPAPDRMHEYSQDEQRDLLAEGIDLLTQASVPRGEIVAFRAGHFAANDATHAAMADVGLKISSNYNPCYRSNNECQLSDPQSASSLYQSESGTWELPISNIRNGKGYRHLQITALSAAEITAYLDQAQRSGVSDAVIVTHSFEQFYLQQVTPPRGRINSINAARLSAVCRFLAAEPERFQVATMPELAHHIEHQKPQQGVEKGFAPALRKDLRLRRNFEQIVKKLDTFKPLPGFLMPRAGV